MQEINQIKSIGKENSYKPSISDEAGSRIKRKMEYRMWEKTITALNKVTACKKQKKYVCLHCNGMVRHKVANVFKKSSSVNNFEDFQYSIRHFTS